MVIAIFGPTASGKSAVAEAIAERIPAELVSADSMQVYRGLPILTNQSEHPTRLVGIWDLDHEASVGEYQELAHAAIDEILATGRTPVVVGGSTSARAGCSSAGSRRTCAERSKGPSRRRRATSTACARWPSSHASRRSKPSSRGPVAMPSTSSVGYAEFRALLACLRTAL